MADNIAVEHPADLGGSMGATAGALAPAVELVGITKAFPGVVANKDITTIADLKGKVIGVNTSTKSSKTTSQQLAGLKHHPASVDNARAGLGHRKSAFAKFG